MTGGHSSHGLLLECTDGFMSSISQAPEGCSEDVSGFLGGGRDRVWAAFIELGCHSARRAAPARDPPQTPSFFPFETQGNFQGCGRSSWGRGESLCRPPPHCCSAKADPARCHAHFWGIFSTPVPILRFHGKNLLFLFSSCLGSMGDRQL